MGAGKDDGQAARTMLSCKCFFQLAPRQRLFTVVFMLCAQVKVSNYPFNNLIYSASDRSCSNVIVGYDLQILTGVAFSANNLQNKVCECY
jgi:hypothetical protein